MNISSNEVKIYRLEPEEIERLLSAKYGGKIAAVNSARLARQNQKRAAYAASHKK